MNLVDERASAGKIAVRLFNIGVNGICRHILRRQRLRVTGNPCVSKAVVRKIRFPNGTPRFQTGAEISICGFGLTERLGEKVSVFFQKLRIRNRDFLSRPRPFGQAQRGKAGHVLAEIHKIRVLPQQQYRKRPPRFFPPDRL